MRGGERRPATGAGPFSGSGRTRAQPEDPPDRFAQATAEGQAARGRCHPAATVGRARGHGGRLRHVAAQLRLRLLPAMTVLLLAACSALHRPASPCGAGEVNLAPRGVHVAQRVPEVFGAFGLARGAGVPCPGDDLGRPRREVDAELPQPQGPRALRRGEVGLPPMPSAVDGHVDPGDLAGCRRRRVAADLYRPAGRVCPSPGDRMAALRAATPRDRPCPASASAGSASAGNRR